MLFRFIQLFALLVAAFAFSADAFAHRRPGHHYPPHGPGYYYPPHAPGYYPPHMPMPTPGYYPMPGYGVGVTCFAQSNFGQLFYSTGPNPYVAQNLALQYCYSTGAACMPTGCR